MVADHTPPPTKVCKRCNSLKLLDDFHRDRSKADGRYGQCMECRRKKKWRRCHHCDQYVPPEQFVGESADTVECVQCVASETRLCKKCGVTHPWSRFSRNKAQSMGWEHTCVGCKYVHDRGFNSNELFCCLLCHDVRPLSEKSTERNCSECVSDIGRKCTRCMTFLPWSEFNLLKNGLNGHGETCRRCKRELGRAAGWHRDAKQRWRDENRELVRRTNQKSLNKRRAALNLAETDDIDHREHIESYSPRFPDGSIPCYLCHEPILNETFSIDHVIPIIGGGPDTAWNTLPAHRSCNSGKNARPANPKTHGFVDDQGAVSDAIVA